MPTHFITLFIGLPRLIYFFFTPFTPMEFLLNSLGFLTQLLHLYLLLLSGLLAFKPTHWVYQFVSWVSLAHLLLLYLLFLWAYYFIHWTSLAHLLLLYLFFISMGLLAINSAISVHWACFLISLPFVLLTFSIVGFLLLLGLLSKMGINRNIRKFIMCAYGRLRVKRISEFMV